MSHGDLEHVGVMLADCFDRGMRPYLAYAQRGVTDHLAVHLKYPESFASTYYVVATDAGDNAIGFAEFETLAHGVGFLSYLCVAPASRGTGVATALIEGFCRANPAIVGLELDVFSSNAPALGLYAKLGFREASRRLWLARALPIPSSPLELSGIEASEASHAMFGFSKVSAEWQGATVQLGRIGTSVLRCYDIEAFGDSDLLAGVKSTFGSLTEALVIIPALGGMELPTDCRQVGAGIRMVKSLDDGIPIGRGRHE